MFEISTHTGSSAFVLTRDCDPAQEFEALVIRMGGNLPSEVDWKEVQCDASAYRAEDGGGGGEGGSGGSGRRSEGEAGGELERGGVGRQGGRGGWKR